MVNIFVPISESTKNFLEYIKNNSKDITYEILESNIENIKATVTVAVTYVNGEKFFQLLLQKFLYEACH